jgi:2-phosphosulfolactate phosphatase
MDILKYKKFYDIMEIKKLSCLDGAKKAKGLVVIIDVFRASNTIISCLKSGCKNLIPIENIEDAFDKKNKLINETKIDDLILIGERKGLKIDGFDYGNSPSEISKLNLKNKIVILTTSAGSKGILYSKNSRDCDEIIIGSFANISAVVDNIILKNPKNVSLIPIGFEAVKKADEDEFCAKMIKYLIELKIKQKPLKLFEKNNFENEKKNYFEKIKSELLISKNESNGTNRLKKLEQYNDLEFCLKLDTTNIIPKFDFKKGVLEKLIL